MVALVKNEKEAVISNVEMMAGEIPFHSNSLETQFTPKRCKCDKHSDKITVMTVKQEIELYLFEIYPNDDQNDENYLFEWWRDHQRIFPNLSRIARKVLVLPATSLK